MTLRRFCLAIAVLIITLPATAPAATLWRGGAVSLSYDQFLGPLDGVFSASGVLWPEGPGGETAASGAGGFAGVQDDQWLVAAVGIAAGDGPGLVNAALVVLHGDGTDLPGPGSWSVTPAAYDATFVLVLGVAATDIPAEITPETVAALLGSVEAEHILVAVSGTVALDQINAGGLAGTFRGAMLDKDNPLITVTVNDGVFDLSRSVTGNESLSVSEIKLHWR